jgi:hypothetical protein
MEGMPCLLPLYSLLSTTTVVMFYVCLETLRFIFHGSEKQNVVPQRHAQLMSYTVRTGVVQYTVQQWYSYIDLRTVVY